MGTYAVHAFGTVQAELADENFLVEATFSQCAELLIGFGAVRAAPNEEIGFTWPFPLYRFVYIGRHSAAADNTMEAIVRECAQTVNFCGLLHHKRAGLWGHPGG